MGDRGSAGSRPGAVASIGNAIVTIASIGVGVTIATQLGASSGVEVAEASRSALQHVRPQLIAAEILKLLSAALIMAAALAAHRTLFRSTVALAIATIAAVLIGLAGGLGLLAIGRLEASPGQAVLPQWVAAAGLGSVALVGFWAATVAARTAPFPNWLRLVGYGLAAIGVMTVLIPPAGMLFGLLAIAWWVGLARRFSTAVARNLQPTPAL